MTLGAQRAGIAKLVLVSGAKLALLGCGLGVLGSLAVSRLVSSFLFGVSATDPLIYMTVRPNHDDDGAARLDSARQRVPLPPIPWTLCGRDRAFYRCTVSEAS